jgi:hypothetical protein
MLSRGYGFDVVTLQKYLLTECLMHGFTQRLLLFRA